MKTTIPSITSSRRGISSLRPEKCWANACHALADAMTASMTNITSDHFAICVNQVSGSTTSLAHATLNHALLRVSTEANISEMIRTLLKEMRSMKTTCAKTVATGAKVASILLTAFNVLKDSVLLSSRTIRLTFAKVRFFNYSQRFNRKTMPVELLVMQFWHQNRKSHLHSLSPIFHFEWDLMCAILMSHRLMVRYNKACMLILSC